MSVENAGPVAGRDVSISGQQAAGRDLHYHEGFRIRSRMRRPARRLLRWGLFTFVVGLLISVVGFAIYGSELFASIEEGFNSTGFDDPVQVPNTDSLIAGFAIFAGGAVLNFIGLVMMIVAAFMRREQVQEAIPTNRR